VVSPAKTLWSEIFSGTRKGLQEVIADGWPQGNESRLTGARLEGSENFQQVMRVEGGALAASFD
jgi:hypothetical protein